MESRLGDDIDDDNAMSAPSNADGSREAFAPMLDSIGTPQLQRGRPSTAHGGLTDRQRVVNILMREGPMTSDQMRIRLESDGRSLNLASVSAKLSKFKKSDAIAIVDPKKKLWGLLNKHKNVLASTTVDPPKPKAQPGGSSDENPLAKFHAKKMLQLEEKTLQLAKMEDEQRTLMAEIRALRELVQEMGEELS